MKKIIVGVVAMAAAVAAQAASVSWTCTNVYKDADNKSSGIAYLVTTDQCADFSALAGKGAADMLAALGSSYSWTPTTAGTYSASAENAALGMSDSSSYQAYIVVFDTATVTDDSKFYVTTTKAVETYTGDNTAKVAFGSQATPSKASGAWASVGGGGEQVPEPTSGLLLLVGLAGLALRRKQA